MYPISLGYDEAVRRIKQLIKNGHHAEALITSVFTLEKTVRRSLHFMVVSRGFTSKHVKLLLDRKGFEDLKKLWPCFEKSHCALPDVIGAKTWQRIPKAVEMRNKLVHGIQVFQLKDCKCYAEYVLDALASLRTYLQREIGFDGWSKLPIRKKSILGWSDQSENRSKVGHSASVTA